MIPTVMLFLVTFDVVQMKKRAEPFRAYVVYALLLLAAYAISICMTSDAANFSLFSGLPPIPAPGGGNGQ